MAVLNQAFVDGAHAVVRAVARQAAEATSTALNTAVTSALSSSATSPSPASTFLSSTDSPTPLSTLTPTPDPTTSANPGNTGNQNNNNNNTGTSSPLLFFVALGFGVVFTNLWIIVGVKYCFRYNARNRQLRGLDENGEPINLENMPTRPHRRRREKKLMTMDEVNDKFPMMKYKTWVADRAKEGLPTAGGVSVPPSRANSVRSVTGIVPEVPSKERNSTEDATMTAAGDKSKTTNADGTTGNAEENGAALTHTQTAGSIITKDPDAAHGSDDEDDDHIDAAVPPELLAASGDTCAICIDTLEDDDDVRGLTCGHAFHAVCLDPWLTNRRACCPLCKADYYTPKPRPPPADGDPNTPTSPNADPARNNGRANMPRQPPRTLMGWSLREAPRSVLGRYGNTTNVDSNGRARRSDRDRRRRGEASQGNSRATSRTNAQVTRPTPAQEDGQQAGWYSRFRNRFPPFRQNQSAQAQATEPASGTTNADTTATPSQLEAGTRSTS
ncbi:hypothetical protein JX265_011343 [Neoarthrinium moseri]|uniref:RING-type domain-containing protein n=1 Tax=Neoarthrinium moseri TaxID=1658444 RepID=A0A9Q0AKQ3_9PEZI|nr:hypothetical protein JX265_011343 [Neoarthrinium moseri]